MRDARFGVEVIVDGGEAAEKEAADVREDGGAARRDFPLRKKSVKGAERVVDALSVLEASGLGSERLEEVAGGVRPRLGMPLTET